MVEVSLTFRKRFWAKVDVRGENECWPWTGAKNKKGYGTIHAAGRGSPTLYVHQVAVVLDGTVIPVGKMVHHNCGMRLCVNRKHLEIATYSHNNRGENRGIAERLWGGEPLELGLLEKVNSGGEQGEPCCECLAKER